MKKSTETILYRVPVWIISRATTLYRVPVGIKFCIAFSSVEWVTHAAYTAPYVIRQWFCSVQFSSIMCRLKEMKPIKRSAQYTNTHRNTYGTIIYTKQTYNNNKTRTQSVSTTTTTTTTTNMHTNYVVPITSMRLSSPLLNSHIQTIFSKCYRTSDFLLSSKEHTTKNITTFRILLGVNN
jgi:hypothetical protein